MALDSQAKRMCAAGVGRPYMRVKLPSATNNQEWRMASTNSYCGNNVGVPVVDLNTVPFIQNRRCTQAGFM